jgi:type II secretory pathway component PulF
MPVFEYRGLSATGKQVTGLLEADNSKALRTQLRKVDVFLTDVLGQSEARTGRKAAADREVHVTRLFRGRVSS